MILRNCYLRLFYLLAFTVLLSCGQLVFAQSSGKNSENVKIGFVNIRKILGSAPQLQQIQQKLSAEFDDTRQLMVQLRSEIAKLSNEYNQLIQQQSQGESVLSVQQSIDDKQVDLSKLQQKLNDDFNLRRNEELSKLQSLVINTVAKVSKEKNLDIVFNNTGVIYVNTRIDITPDVYQKLSEQTID